jgi:hypothetical protein
MVVRSITFVALFAFIIAVGCSTGGPKPGTTGTSSAKTIERTEHMAIPEGVNCLVCHKEDIPVRDFHKKYGSKCEECHVKSTWMASRYSHPAWLLAGAHKARCTRCHSKMESFDFSYQCWGCHHDQQATVKTHADRGAKDIANCIECHKEVKL